MYDQCFKPCPNKTDNGFCKTTTCINPLYCNIGTAQYGQGVQKRIITNADRIRSMTDEELAELWLERIDCGQCPVLGECNLTDKDCKRLALEWLKQEANE